jgi:hypothetical protein
MKKFFGIFILLSCLVFAAPEKGDEEDKKQQSIDRSEQSIDFSGLQVPFPTKSSLRKNKAKSVKFSLTELSKIVFDGKGKYSTEKYSLNEK